MKNRSRILLRIVRGVLFAALMSLACMAVLALAVVYTSVSDTALTVFNQLIKLASIFFGVIVCVRPGGTQGFFLGGSVGLLYTASGYGLYCLFNDSMYSFAMLAAEFLISALLGALSGALVANLPVRTRRA